MTILIFLYMIVTMKEPFADTYKHKGMRKSLVLQLKNKGISQPQVLHALEKVPRHYFFESAFDVQAYEDIAFPIGEGQTISQPYTVARQTELLDIRPNDKVLEIGTGSGYQTCILLELGAQVYTIEYNKTLYESAKKKLGIMGYKAHFFCKDGTMGLPAFAPFQKIIVTAGGPQIPNSLLLQLVIGGIIVIPVGNEKTQKMLRIIKISDTEYQKEDFGNYSFVKLLGKEGW
ncbi:MAG: protein-L-isoaspartate(D-aspartate) O-methyltransferase [Cytophagales bacterium]|nr:protein-L-isoaspartate(D-aspartate) O-methyltransferase [Cytophagales bacterium]